MVLDFAIMVFGVAPGAARLHRSHGLLHDLSHASQRLLNLRTIGDLPGGEFVPAQPTGQIGPKLKLPEPALNNCWQRGQARSIRVLPRSSNKLPSPVKVRPGALNHGSKATKRRGSVPGGCRAEPAHQLRHRTWEQEVGQIPGQGAPVYWLFVI